MQTKYSLMPNHLYLATVAQQMLAQRGYPITIDEAGRVVGGVRDQIVHDTALEALQTAQQEGKDLQTVIVAPEAGLKRWGDMQRAQLAATA